jgi:hypothetical protein
VPQVTPAVGLRLQPSGAVPLTAGTFHCYRSIADADADADSELRLISSSP